jgi:hypothetical protein
MAKANPTPIPPFPATIDRSLFGAWLSGITAGEGHFALRLNRHPLPRRTYRSPSALYAIKLRDDDSAAVRLIHAFLACGNVYSRLRRGDPRQTGSKPQITLIVTRFRDLRDVVIPQFDRHPLWAKKARDYAIWKEAVQVICAIQGRSWHYKRVQAGVPVSGGFSRKWGDAELEHFAALADALKAQRVYNSVTLNLPTPKPPKVDQPSLFDWQP